jgi:transposase
VDARGIPLSFVASGANRHDSVLLRDTLAAIVYPRPERSKEPIETLCADAGYVGFPAQAASRLHNYELKVKTRRQEAEEKRQNPGKRARRWVVERRHSWFNRYRKLLVSFEKTEASYNALLALAAALICWRQTISIYG